MSKLKKDESDYIGYFKYEGKLVNDGYLDARQSAQTLIGIDTVLRYFMIQADPHLNDINFEIPIKVRKGSWEALIPQDISHWIMVSAGFWATAYGTTAVKKMAENDFKELGFKDILSKAFKGIKWVVRIAIHLNTTAKKEFLEPKFKETDKEILIGITNENGDILYVPKLYLDMYTTCPDKLFSELTKGIEPGREIEIGLNNKELIDKDDFSKSIKIGFNSKFIFTKKEVVDEVIFPELKHNQYVELEGHVTRGNENTNTIGFEYENHILTCSPVKKNVKDQKNLLFTNCIIKGYIDRLDRVGNPTEGKPKIKYVELIEASLISRDPNLFD